MKVRSQCRKCGQHGHRANGPQCTKPFKSAEGKWCISFIDDIEYYKVTQVEQRWQEWQIRMGTDHSLQLERIHVPRAILPLP